MRLVVTRPEPDASDTAHELIACGHTVIVAPMLRIVDETPPTALATPAAILLTSRNAARAVARWPQARAWRDIPVYAVGGETAAAARSAGFTDVHAGDAGVAGLEELVTAEVTPTAGRLLYAAGHDRAGDLDGGLRARGFTVDLVEAYRAVAAENLPDDLAAALADKSVDGVVFFSRRTAATFAKLVRAARLETGLAGAWFYVLSDEVAAALDRLPTAGIAVAERPDAEHLLRLLD